MNTDILKGNWMQIRGDIKRKWGELTDDDLTMIDGDRDKLIGRIQERYGYSREQAQREFDQFDRDVVSRYDVDRGMGSSRMP